MTAPSSRLLKAVIFDFDGLILDTESAEYDSISSVFDAHGATLDWQLWQSFIGSTDHPHWFDILVGVVAGPLERDRVIAMKRARHGELLASLEPNPGVVDLIEAAVSAGLDIAIASSSPSSWVGGHLADHQLARHFPIRATGDEVERTKPDPALYRLALERLSVEPHHAVAIEDSVNGCRAAAAAGISVVAVPGPMTRGMDFSDADLVVDSLEDLTLDRLDSLLCARGSAGASPS